MRNPPEASLSCSVVPLDMLKLNATGHCFRPVSPSVLTAPSSVWGKEGPSARLQSWAMAVGSGFQERNKLTVLPPRQVVFESELYTPRPLELLPHRSDRRDVEGRRASRFQNARLQGPHPAKTPARPGTCVHGPWPQGLPGGQ